MKITGSKAIIQSLIHEGVDTIFGYPGGAIMPAYDALYDFRHQIRHVLVRHEQGAAHAAEGYARATGKPAVCIATSGPGATNLITGIADAQMDSIPVVFITGQVAKPLLGTDAFQETDVMGVTMPVTKWNYQITEAAEIPLIIAKAFYIARSGRPGPVVIDITKDAQLGMLDWEYSKVDSLPSYNPVLEPSQAALTEAAEIINSAKRPLMLVGHGVLIAGAEEELKLFTEKTGAPVALTLHGLSAIPMAHPNVVGMLGMHGHYAPNMLTNEADVIIAVGMRFDDRVTGNLKTYARNAQIIHIDIDAAEIDKNVISTVAIVADAKVALSELLTLVEEKNPQEWRERFSRLREEEQKQVISAEVSPQSGKIRMGEVIALLSELTDGEAVIVADVGQNQMMSARYYNFKQPNSYITSGGLGTMGYALPAAMGVKIALPDREVVAVCGDGGFQMNIQELATVAQERLPLKVLLLNNSYLGMVRQWQEMFNEERYSCVDLVNPDFMKLADGFGLDSARVTSREELRAGLEAMIKSERGFVLEVVVEKQGKVFPMVPAGACVSDVRLS
ncbi:MAG: biosynthetic-type acetolactate synthase large subunit [bacterium]|nr:biosynthetic-type acetolactate synthase large subunit [bacterium]